MPSNCLLQTHILLILVATFLFAPALLAQVQNQQASGVRTEVYAVAPTRTGEKALHMDLYRPQGRPVQGAVILAHGGSFVTGARDIDENQVYGRALAERGYLTAAISYRLLGDEPVVQGWVATYAQAVRQSSDPRCREALLSSGRASQTPLQHLPRMSRPPSAGCATTLRSWASTPTISPCSVRRPAPGAISALTVAYAMDDYSGESARVTAVIALRGLLLPPGEIGTPLQHRDPPLLILHGEDDERVPPTYADSLFRSAQRAGLYVEYLSAPGFGHELGGAAPAGARAGFNPLRYEEHLAFALLHSLDPEQHAAAVLADIPPSEIVSSQFQVERADWNRWQTVLKQDGVPASTMDAQQLQFLRHLVVEIVSTYRDEISMAYLRSIDLRTLTFAWMGAQEIGQPHYFRIQGEHFVFELDAAQEDGNHVHTVWRDRNSDFGADALRSHYEQHHH